MKTTSHESLRDTGLLIIRVGLGLMFMFHGFPKLTGGPEVWERLGSAMGHFGIDFMPALWGFLAACAEFFGGSLLVAGFCFRTACFFLFFTMFVASAKHLLDGDGLKRAAHAIEAAFVFLGLMFIGPGRWVLPLPCCRKSCRKNDGQEAEGIGQS